MQRAGGGGQAGKNVKDVRVQQRNKLLRMYDKCAVFESLDTGSCLVATRIKEGGTRDLQVLDRSLLPDYGGPSQVMPFEAIFGIYDLLSGSYVALVVESEPFVSVSAMLMRRAKKVLIVPLFRNGKVLSESKQRDENRYLQLLHMAFSEHQFFFSFTSDVTLTQQRIAKFSAKEMEQKHIYTRADPRFFWNSDVISDLTTCGADEWIVPFMSAHVEVRPECEVEGEKFTLLFISRRSRYRQGCRFTKRGIDEQGNVANFVETEQMLIFGDGKISSFVQVRGSIPVLWSSPVLMKYEPQGYLDANKARSIEYAEKHIDELLNQYADDKNHSGVIFINLVDQKKDQLKLGTFFKEVVETIQGRLHGYSLLYTWFDFHHETKGSYKNLSKLVDLVDEQFRAQRFFQKQANGTVTSWQIGVMRTNCMDNLDRTNVVQSLFARRSLLTQLGKLNAVPSSSSSGSSTGSVLDSPFKAFEKIYKTVWANNADAISMGYAGTGALKVDFTKTGKRTLVGMFNDGVNSVMRYYINNFTDGAKQDSIDLLLGNYHPDPSSPSPFTPRPGQETLSTNLIKGFVLMSIIFSALMLFSPSPHDSTSLIMHLLISIGVTSLVNMYIVYAVVKSGSKIGERIVFHPQLRPEPLPQK